VHHFGCGANVKVLASGGKVVKGTGDAGARGGR
jgi:hypothetical protein